MSHLDSQKWICYLQLPAGRGRDGKPLGEAGVSSSLLWAAGLVLVGTAHTEVGTKMGTAHCKQGCPGPAPFLLLAHKVEHLIWKIDMSKILALSRRMCVWGGGQSYAKIFDHLVFFKIHSV